jgi:hypothetical protein
MHTTAKYLGLAALAGTIAPAALFMVHAMPLDMVKSIMLLSTIVWFAAAPFWMKVA